MESATPNMKWPTPDPNKLSKMMGLLPILSEIRPRNKEPIKLQKLNTDIITPILDDMWNTRTN